MKKITIKKILLFLSFILIHVALDLMIKDKVEQSLVTPYQQQSLGQGEHLFKYPFPDQKEDEWLVVREIEIIENFWNILYTRNYNVGFSSLSFLEKYFPALEISFYLRFVQLLSLIIIFVIFASYGFEYAIPFNLIISGGLANVSDRFYRGYVVDYMKWYIPDSPFLIFNPWPIFNLADIYITLGGVSLLISLIIYPISKVEKKPKP